jgi:hypothetical protein
LRRVLGFCGGFSSEASGVLGSGLPARVFGGQALGCLGGLGQHLVKACGPVRPAGLDIGLRAGPGAAVQLRHAFGFRFGRARGWPGPARGDGGLMLALEGPVHGGEVGFELTPPLQRGLRSMPDKTVNGG